MGIFTIEVPAQTPLESPTSTAEVRQVVSPSSSISPEITERKLKPMAVPSVIPTLTFLPTPIPTPRLEPEIIYPINTPEPTTDPYTVRLEEFRRLSITLYMDYSNRTRPIYNKIAEYNRQSEQESEAIRNLPIPNSFISNQQSQVSEKYGKLTSPLYDDVRRISAEYEQKVAELSRIYGFYPLYPKLP